jgi:hypothetical protein
MKTKLSAFALAALVVLSVGGCRTADVSGIANRIQEKSDSYSKLTPDQQKAIHDGWIERGYTADMVYMVMGKPTNVAVKDSSRGKVGMWSYDEFSRASSDAQDTRNNPGNPHYISQTVANISANVRDEAPSAVKPAAFSATGGNMGALNVADLYHSRVYLFFANGRVTEIKLQSEI